MKFEERAEQIMLSLQQDGVVRVEELAARFGISEVSVRKDLKKLEKEGKLQRTFGGATRLSMDASKRQRLEKIQRIAAMAAEEVQDGDCIILNAGSTTLAIARELLRCKRIKVITNSVPVAREMSHHEGIELIFLGGEIDTDAVFTFGPDAISQLEQYKADKLFLSVSGITCGKGLTSKHMTAASLMSKMIERANEVIVTADDSKMGYESFYYIGDLSSVDKLITNNEAEETRELDRIKQAGIDVICC